MTRKFKVLHFPQIPCEPFEEMVKSYAEAKVVADILARQHLYLFDNNFIPDYANEILIQEFSNGEWQDVDLND